MPSDDSRRLKFYYIFIAFFATLVTITLILESFLFRLLHRIFRLETIVKATSLKNVPTTDEINSQFFGFTFTYGNLTEKIKRKLKPFNIRVAYQNSGKLSDLVWINQRQEH